MKINLLIENKLPVKVKFIGENNDNLTFARNTDDGIFEIAVINKYDFSKTDWKDFEKIELTTTEWNKIKRICK